MNRRVRQIVESTLEALRNEGLFEGELPPVTLERPKRPEHGDAATNVALVLAKRAARPPREIAEAIATRLRADASGTIASVDVAGPGFLNVRLDPNAFLGVLANVHAEGEQFGFAPAGSRGRRVNVEFVSANPTGPLHFGHGRGAVLGDCIARLLRATGWDVTTEFYINDRGAQVAALGRTLHYRYLQALGHEAVEPEGDGWYRGEYMVELGQRLAREAGDAHAGKPAGDPFFRDYAKDILLDVIRRDLAALGVQIDVWSSERALTETGLVEETLSALRARGLVAEQDGATMLLTGERFQDKEGRPKNEVLVKSDGELTYFATDIPYHLDKLRRGADLLIDVWGADHHGHVPRLRFALECAGADPTRFEVVLVQMVRAYRDGVEVKVSKRAGQYLTLAEIVDEVGPSAARFFFVLRRHDSQLDFDVSLAKRQDQENPVFYVQYAHARCCSIVRKAREEHQLEVPAYDATLARALEHPIERDVMLRLGELPEVVAAAADARDPHGVGVYLRELAGLLASHYTQTKRTGDTVLPLPSTMASDGWRERWPWDRTRARLMWLDAARQVLANALRLLGVDAPEKMARLDVDETDGSTAPAEG
ncbi:MAG: arginine--tRNA ligase [Deltaproteobacteria bacterium]|nr:arginine--tRNA ligase [Deltaproteobacteria bacterium]